LKYSQGNSGHRCLEWIQKRSGSKIETEELEMGSSVNDLI